MPAGSLEQVVFRMDLLHAAAAAGVPVLNPPRAVEACVDKYLTNVRLARGRAAGAADGRLPARRRRPGGVRPTSAATWWSSRCSAPRAAAWCASPTPRLAWRTFRALERTGQVIYLQQFVRHPGWDLRAFVIGGKVVAAMRRTAARRLADERRPGRHRRAVRAGSDAEAAAGACGRRRRSGRRRRRGSAAGAGRRVVRDRGERRPRLAGAGRGDRAWTSPAAVVRFLAEEYRP